MKKFAIKLIGLVALVSCNKESGVLNDAESIQLNGKVKSVVEVTTYENSEERKITTTFLFNEKGYFTEITHTSAAAYGTDTIKTSTKRVFDYKNDNVVEITDADDNGREQKFIKKTDDKGRILELKTDSSDEGGYTITYSYTNGGKEATITAVTALRKEELKEKVTFDEKGRVLTEISQGRDGKITDKTTYKYNDKGYLEEVIREFGGVNQKRVEQFKYKYDAKGSAVTRELYTNGEKINTSQRTIEYY